MVLAVLTGVKWNLILVLLWIMLVINDVEHHMSCTWEHHVPIGHLYVFFRKIHSLKEEREKYLHGFFAHFKNQVICFLFFCVCVACLFVLLLSCMRSLYILHINPLTDIWIANIFSHYIGCLFNLLVVSFAVSKRLSLMQSHLFIFAFVVCVFGVISKQSLGCLRSLKVMMIHDILWSFGVVYRMGWKY